MNFAKTMLPFSAKPGVSAHGAHRRGSSGRNISYSRPRHARRVEA
jgi:hypothetical protein